MALSESVETSLKDAEQNLRNALSFAARQERPMVCKVVAGMISDIDSLIKMDNLIDTLEERTQGSSGSWGTFFNDEE